MGSDASIRYPVGRPVHCCQAANIVFQCGEWCPGKACPIQPELGLYSGKCCSYQPVINLIIADPEVQAGHYKFYLSEFEKITQKRTTRGYVLPQTAKCFSLSARGKNNSVGIFDDQDSMLLGKDGICWLWFASDLRPKSLGYTFIFSGLGPIIRKYFGSCFDSEFYSCCDFCFCMYHCDISSFSFFLSTTFLECLNFEFMEVYTFAARCWFGSVCPSYEPFDWDISNFLV